jgi:hypothetical protein
MYERCSRVLGAILLLSFLPAGVIQSQDFYPLDPGNLWSLRVFENSPLPWDSSFVRISVSGDTVLSNGHRYARLSQEDVLGANYVRADSAYVYYYSLQDSVEVAMYNLRSQPDDVDSIILIPSELRQSVS